MSYLTNVRRNFLVPTGNLPVWQGASGSDTNLYAKGANDKPVLRPAVGQMVFIDTTRSGLHSVDFDDIDDAVSPVPNSFAIGVVTRDVVNIRGKEKLVKTIQYSAMGTHGMSTCGVEYANATPSKCGQTSVVDFYFGCIECDQPYTIRFGYEDDTTREQFPTRRRPNKVITVTPDCSLPCGEDCARAEVTCDDLLCKFMDKLSQGFNDNYGLTYETPTGLELPQRKYVREFGPIKVSKLYPWTQTWTLSLGTDACSDCLLNGTIEGIQVDKIDLATSDGPNNPTGPISGDAAPVNHEFVNHVVLDREMHESEADRTRTLFPVLDELVEEIEAVLGDTGTVTYSVGTGNCCDITLEINSCNLVTFLRTFHATEGSETVIELDGLDIAEASGYTEKYNFDPIEVPACQSGCDPEALATWVPCGLRFIADPLQLPCDCQDLPPNQTLRLLTRYVTVEGLGFEQWHTNYKQTATFPVNTGYQLKQLEYEANVGGDFGRDYQEWDDFSGNWGIPTRNSRVKKGKIECPKTYCTIDIGGRNDYDGGSLGAGYRTAPNYVTTVAIAESDTITTASFVAGLSWFLTKGCCAINPVTCDEDIVKIAANVVSGTGLTDADPDLIDGTTIIGTGDTSEGPGGSSGGQDQ